MPSICECTIKLVNNSDGKYLPGQPLVGVVELRVREPFKIRGVSIRIIGYALASWTKYSVFSSTEYHGHHHYIDKKVYLEGSKNGKKYKIETGTHSYQFACVLPDDLPASFKGVHGQIRYWAIVKVHRPWRCNLEDIAKFKVLPHVDLNEFRTALNKPCKMKVQDDTGRLHISAEIPVGGYVSGETIALRIESTNNSRRMINHFYARLIRNESYISDASKPRKESFKTTIVDASCAGVSPGEKVTRDLTLPIPGVLPSSNKMRLITIWYELEVECQMPSFVANPRIHIPIVIGTVPFASRPLPRVENANVYS